jgi:hypothetical protein
MCWTASSEMIEPLLGDSGHLADEAGHRALAGLARLYGDMGRWAEAGLPFPRVPPEADSHEIDALADEVVGGLMREVPGATHAMIQGEFTLAHALVRKLQQIGIVCVAATRRREVVEQSGDTKTTRFDFVRFREYS